MSEFITDNHVKNLPDIFCKSKDSNNFKLLELERLTVEEYRQTLRQLFDMIDLDNAKGKTLDLYGETVGQSRGRASDEQYILMIKAKLMQNLSNGSYPSVLNSMCTTFGCEPSQIYIEESDIPCKVNAVKLPLESIIKADITPEDTEKLIKSLLPVGVSLESYLYEGTFTFSDVEDEYKENEGFCDVEDGEMGGYFGIASGGLDIIKNERG